MTKKKKIFITEDEFIVSQNLEFKLNNLGYDVIGTSPTGEMAIHAIRKEQPDLVLMDIMLAGDLDGIQTASVIRKEFDLPIIFLTAYSSEEIYKRAAITEPYAYIIKPFEERELEINIAIALYKHNMERQFARKQKELEELNNNLDRLIEERTEHLLVEIAERKKAQELKQRFYNIIEQTGDHVFITDTAGSIEYANRALIRHTGYSREELIGSKSSIFKSGIYSDHYYSKLWSKITSGEPFSDEIVNRKKNGEIYAISQIIIPLKDQDNNITHFASISRDYTKKRVFEKKILDVQEKERSRISKELHDSIGQNSIAVQMALSSVDIKDDRAYLDLDVYDNIVELIERLTSSIRETSYNLMPSVLKDYGLQAAIRKNFALLEKATNFKFELIDESVLSRLPEDIELTLFRIVQESANNSIKHSGGTQFKVELETDPRFIIMKLSDDGVGFELNLDKTGQGLINMKHRVSLHNGLFNITTSKNKGVLIKVIIPYEKNK